MPLVREWCLLLYHLAVGYLLRDGQVSVYDALDLRASNRVPQAVCCIEGSLHALCALPLSIGPTAETAGLLLSRVG